MKYGYSVLLGEIVPATEIEYEDCAHEQITCPECHEPVFKVAASTRASGHLSHYRQHDDILTCELRVNSLTIGEVETRNVVSRGQTKERFFELLRELVMMQATSDTGQHMRAFMRHKEIHWLLDGFLQAIATRADTRDKLREMTGDHAKLFGELLESQLMGKFRRRIATDMLDMVMATPKEVGMRSVLALSFARMVERSRTDRRHQTEPRSADAETSAILEAHRAVNTSRQKALNIIRRMMEEKVPTEDGPMSPFELFQFMMFRELPMTMAALDYNTMVPRLQSVMGRRMAAQ